MASPRARLDRGDAQRARRLGAPHGARRRDARRRPRARAESVRSSRARARRRAVAQDRRDLARERVRPRLRGAGGRRRRAAVRAIARNDRALAPTSTLRAAASARISAGARATSASSSRRAGRPRRTRRSRASRATRRAARGSSRRTRRASTRRSCGRAGPAALDDLDASQRALLPPLPYPSEPTDAYRSRLERVFAHAKSPENMMAAQALWDASMAHGLLRHLAEHPSHRVLHVCGRFHVEHFLGVVDQLWHYLYERPPSDAFRKLADDGVGERDATRPRRRVRARRLRGRARRLGRGRARADARGPRRLCRADRRRQDGSGRRGTVGRGGARAGVRGLPGGVIARARARGRAARRCLDTHARNRRPRVGRHGPVL